MVAERRRDKKIIIVAGPTASGKSALALAIAERFGGEIINADSMQVYRELRVLTARPDATEEARAALLAAIGAGEDEKMSATDVAHVEIIAERLRLLYVGITRARQYLAVSWSREIPAGMRMRPVPMAAAYHHLANYYKREYGDGK